MAEIQKWMATEGMTISKHSLIMATRKPRVRVSDLQAIIANTRGQLDKTTALLTESDNKHEWTLMEESHLHRYKAFVQATCKQMHLPCSFVLAGIEEGTLHSLTDAMHVLEQSVMSSDSW